MKRKVKFEIYKNRLDGSQVEKKTNQLQKNKIDINSLNKDHKEFIKNNKSILKIQQIFISKRHVFDEEISLLKKIALISNDDKRMQSIDSIET